jgi:hypothetical protein
MPYKVKRVTSGDFNRIFNLVGEIEPLRQFDQYVYKLICDYFSANCLLLEWHDELVGIALGFYIPSSRDAFYIFQFGVIKNYRKSNISIDFLRVFIQQFSACSCFYFTIRGKNSRRLQFLRLIEILSKKPVVLLETIQFSNEELDFKYLGSFDNRCLNIASSRLKNVQDDLQNDVLYDESQKG